MSAEAKPAWLENWRSFFYTTELLPQSDDQKARIRLAAAAPALVRVLLLVEWGRQNPMEDETPFPRMCVSCAFGTHRPGCPIDAALTLAGFATQEGRNAARAEMKARAK